MAEHVLHLGDCLEVMRTMPDCSVDAVVTDPPYGISFMGKKWDYDVPSVDIWKESLRVLKPGGHLLAFAGTRTQHRMALNIEDAGFEIRDLVMWHYGSGFPKSHDVSKAIDKIAGAEREVIEKKISKSGGMAHIMKTNADHGYRPNDYYSKQGNVIDITAPATPEAQQWEGWGTALKPATEIVTMARKPFKGTVAANVLEHGTGAINVDGCRVGAEPRPLMVRTDTVVAATSMAGVSTGATDSGEVTTLGRWPANLIHDGSDEVVGLFPESASSTPSVTATYGTNKDGRENSTYGKGLYSATPNRPPIGDTGSAARFFKQCKGYTEAWPSVTAEPANTVGNCSSQQRQFVASALSDAVTWALQGAVCSSVSLAPSTSATASELRQLCESVITAIQSIGPKFWHESEPARLTLKLSHASFAVHREQTGITTITASHWTFGGSADPVTFSITGTSTAAGDQASAPRAFYTAKASKSDREDGNNHPTVKPTDLMRYLCRLVTPPGGTVLDPFMGSGSTIKGALAEGFNAVGIERDPEYFAIAQKRLNGLNDLMAMLDDLT